LTFASAVAIASVVAIARKPPSPVPAASASAVAITTQGAVWLRTEVGASTNVRLEDGELEIHVEHRGPRHDLRVLLPDGELEDIGTTFRVVVHDGRTARVDVREGAVLLRRVGQAPRLVAAGESWHAEPAPFASAAPSASEPPPITPPPAPPAKRALETGDGTREFRDAVALFEGGGSDAAAKALRAFVARHPSDPHAEDAAYLLVLALRRTGDLAFTREAAKSYLARFPAGFRRAEIAPLAADAEQSPNTHGGAGE
jgi:hypothetical protein